MGETTLRQRPRGPVKQFSVFTPNRLGRLHTLTTLLASRNVHILALTVLDTTDSAIIRLVVDDPDDERLLIVGIDFDEPRPVSHFGADLRKLIRKHAHQ